MSGYIWVCPFPGRLAILQVHRPFTSIAHEAGVNLSTSKVSFFIHDSRRALIEYSSADGKRSDHHGGENTSSRQRKLSYDMAAFYALTRY